MPKHLTSLLYLTVFLLLISCKSEDEKLKVLKDAKEMEIQENIYGGIGGYGECFYRIYQDGNQEILVLNENRADKETMIMTKEKQEQFDKFLEFSFDSNLPDRKMSNSCMGLDREYIISSGFTEVTLRPNYEADSIFNLILYK